MAAKSQHFLDVNLPPDKTFPLIISALNSIQAQITMADEKTGLVFAKKSASFISWGETIRVWMTPSLKGTFINILSECAMPTQIVDWGRNHDNIMEFVRAFYYFLQFSPQPPVPPLVPPQ